MREEIGALSFKGISKPIIVYSQRCRRNEPVPRSVAALLAGAIAIALNMAALSAADLVPLDIAHGGLLRFLMVLTGGVLAVPPGDVFQAGFHIGVGLAMALLYAFALEPVMRGPSWLRGRLYALAVWLTNALIVLPTIGEGFAGSRRLTVAGIIWFAAAHTLFFVVLGVLYARLRQRRHLVTDRARP